MDAQAEFDRLVAPVLGQTVQQTDIRDLEAWSALLDGRLPKASRQWESTAGVSPLNAPSALALAGRAYLWSGDLAGARAALEAGEALALYERARDQMREGKALFELALVGVDMAALLDPAAPAIVAAIAESRQVLDLLRAAPLLSRLEAAADGSLRAPPHTESPARSHAERRAGSAARTAESDATRT